MGQQRALRIPASLMEAANLELDEVVDLREEDGRIVIEPVRRKAYELEKLLARITRENRHHAIDFGLPLGNEVW